MIKFESHKSLVFPWEEVWCYPVSASGVTYYIVKLRGIEGYWLPPSKSTLVDQSVDKSFDTLEEAKFYYMMIN